MKPGGLWGKICVTLGDHLNDVGTRFGKKNMAKRAVTLNAEVLESRRIACGLTLQALASELDVSLETVRLWHQRGAKIGVANFASLCRLLQVDAQALLVNSQEESFGEAQFKHTNRSDHSSAADKADLFPVFGDERQFLDIGGRWKLTARDIRPPHISEEDFVPKLYEGNVELMSRDDGSVVGTAQDNNGNTYVFQGRSSDAGALVWFSFKIREKRLNAGGTGALAVKPNAQILTGYYLTKATGQIKNNAEPFVFGQLVLERVDDRGSVKTQNLVSKPADPTLSQT